MKIIREKLKRQTLKSFIEEYELTLIISESIDNVGSLDTDAAIKGFSVGFEGSTELRDADTNDWIWPDLEDGEEYSGSEQEALDYLATVLRGKTLICNAAPKYQIKVPFIETPTSIVDSPPPPDDSAAP